MAMDVDYVSARAEAQVQERTKKRFSVPGAWRQGNLEGKATLRAIIDEGSWQRFTSWCRGRSQTMFADELFKRIKQAVDEGRLLAHAQLNAQTLGPQTALPIAA